MIATPAAYHLHHAAMRLRCASVRLYRVEDHIRCLVISRLLRLRCCCAKEENGVICCASFCARMKTSLAACCAVTLKVGARLRRTAWLRALPASRLVFSCLTASAHRVFAVSATAHLFCVRYLCGRVFRSLFIAFAAVRVRAAYPHSFPAYRVARALQLWRRGGAFRASSRGMAMGKRGGRRNAHRARKR